MLSNTLRIECEEGGERGREREKESEWRWICIYRGGGEEKISCLMIINLRTGLKD